MKIALAQLNYHIGNIDNNVSKIISKINEAKKQKADLVVFSELAVCGYPPHDFLEFDDFIDKCQEGINIIAKECDKIAAIVGSPSVNQNPNGKVLFNSAFFLSDSKITSIHNKGLLPTYDVFDEYRYFEPAQSFECINYKDRKIALTICEDIWDDYAYHFYKNEYKKMYSCCPMAELSKQSPDLMINISGSPFSYNHTEARLKILKRKTEQYNLPIIYVNQTGANTDLIFDGGSLFMNSDGEITEELKYFEEDFKIIETETAKTKISVQEHPKTGGNKIQRIHDALVLGIKDYFKKSGFSKAILGLSGGIDSAVTAALAAEALGGKNIKGVLLPSVYSSEHSVKDAMDLVKNLDCDHDIISIGSAFDAFLKSLEPSFKDLPSNVTEENIQARARGVLLMALSNKFGYILLNTSNKSELAVGYGTLYGDMCGGLGVLGDVYKTEVFELARYINRAKEIIPENTIIKPPSAELRPDQKDSDSLPDYEILDKILFEYIDNRQGPEELKKSFDSSLVNKIMKLVNTNEYKRYQTPPILRVSDKAFGPGRKMPIVAKYF